MRVFGSLPRWCSWDSILTFPTEKYIVIKDKWLGATYYCLQFGVLVYLVNSVYFNKSFLATSTPSASISAWVTGANPVGNISDIAATSAYCECWQFPDTPTCRRYAHHFEEGSLSDYACVHYPVAQTLINSNANVFAVTAVQETTTHGVITEAGDECAPTIGVETLTDRRGRACLYGETRNWINIGAELNSLGIRHSYTSDLDVVNNMACTLRRAGNNTDIVQTVAGEPFNASIKQWLEWAGVDLDMPMNEQPFAWAPREPPGDDGQHPMLRVSGVRLNVRVLMYNWGYTSGSSLNKRRTCVIQLEPELRLTRTETIPSAYPGLLQAGMSTSDLYAVGNARPVQSRGDLAGVDFSTTVKSFHGIEVQLSSGGKIGTLDLIALIMALTSGFVLSNAAGKFVQVLAMFCRGTKSQMYYSILREEVDYRKVFARYALRCLAAAFLYAQMDNDASLSIDAHEMYLVLKNIFELHLDTDELIALTDFVMTTVGAAQATPASKETNFLEEELTCVGFMELFTDDDMNINTMKGLLELETSSKTDVVDEKYQGFKRDVQALQSFTSFYDHKAGLPGGAGSATDAIGTVTDVAVAADDAPVSRNGDSQRGDRPRATSLDLTTRPSRPGERQGDGSWRQGEQQSSWLRSTLKGHKRSGSSMHGAASQHGAPNFGGPRRSQSPTQQSRVNSLMGQEYSAESSMLQTVSTATWGRRQMGAASGPWELTTSSLPEDSLAAFPPALAGDGPWPPPALPSPGGHQEGQYSSWTPDTGLRARAQSGLRPTQQPQGPWNQQAGRPQGPVPQAGGPGLQAPSRYWEGPSLQAAQGQAQGGVRWDDARTDASRLAAHAAQWGGSPEPAAGHAADPQLYGFRSPPGNWGPGSAADWRHAPRATSAGPATRQQQPERRDGGLSPVSAPVSAHSEREEEFETGGHSARRSPTRSPLQSHQVDCLVTPGGDRVGTRLRLTHLGAVTGCSDLRAMCEMYGPVSCVEMCQGTAGECFALVDFADARHAKRAQQSLHHSIAMPGSTSRLSLAFET